MWLNIKTMPLQALVDKVAKSRMWSRISWKIEDEGTSKARFVYEITTGGGGTTDIQEISFKEVCEMFGWKNFTIHPSRLTIVVEHTAKHLKDMGS